MLVRRLTRVFLGLGMLVAAGCCDEGPAPPASAGFVDGKAMPSSGHRVEWGTPGVPCTMKAGSTVAVAVIVKNVGDQTWRDVESSHEGKSAVRLAYRWWDSGHKAVVIDYSPVRGDLRAPLPPGKSATLAVEVVAMPTPGAYLLQLDLVEEMVAWFQDRDAATLLVPVTIN